MKTRTPAPELDTPQGAQTGPSADLSDPQAIYGNAYVQEMLKTNGALPPQEFDRIQQDRNSARTELKDKFEVVPDDFMGPRLPNQVTQAEYDKICTQYSDIRLGKSDLKFDFGEVKDPANRELLQQKSQEDVVKLLQTHKGREALEALAYNKDGKTTTVNLARATKGDPDSNADLCAGEQDPHGKLEPGNADSTAKDPSRASDVRIRYVPGQSVDLPAGKDGERKSEPTTSDQVLLHELDHARRQTSGTFQGEPLTSGPKTDLLGYPSPCDLMNGETRAPRTPLVQDEDTARKAENAYAAERRLLGPGRGERPSYLTPGMWDTVKPRP